jgi:predicted alpha/beta hydrolase family esterase
MEKAFGTSPSDRRHFDWSFVQDCDDADAKMMDEIEAQMCSDWMKDMDREFDADVEREADAFFSENSE